MKLSKAKPPRPLAFNMTPMIDIVFLLIIFFMTVSQITRTVDVPLPLPRVVDGNVSAKTATLTINLDSEGTLLIQGKKTSLEKAIRTIESRLEKFGRDPQKIKIQLRCHRECECRHVSKLLERLSSLGITNIRSAVTDT